MEPLKNRCGDLTEDELENFLSPYTLKTPQGLLYVCISTPSHFCFKFVLFMLYNKTLNACSPGNICFVSLKSKCFPREQSLSVYCFTLVCGINLKTHGQNLYLKFTILYRSVHVCSKFMKNGIILCERCKMVLLFLCHSRIKETFLVFLLF